MTREPNCYFCAKLDAPDGFPPADVVWQFPNSVAILGPWQFYTGYCILISRDHAAELRQLGPVREAYVAEMCLLAEAIEACFQPHKLNYELLGNVVPHLHWHIFPRSANDPERLKPVWLGFERAETDAAEKARLSTGTLSREECVKRLQGWLANRLPA